MPMRSENDFSIVMTSLMLGLVFLVGILTIIASGPGGGGAGGGAGPPPGAAILRLDNVSSHSIVGFFVSPHDEQVWGDNLLEDLVIAPDTVHDFTIENCDTNYDFRIVFTPDRPPIELIDGQYIACGEIYELLVSDEEVTVQILEN